MTRRTHDSRLTTTQTGHRSLKFAKKAKNIIKKIRSCHDQDTKYNEMEILTTILLIFSGLIGGMVVTSSFPTSSLWHDEFWEKRKIYIKMKQTQTKQHQEQRHTGLFGVDQKSRIQRPISSMKASAEESEPLSHNSSELLDNTRNGVKLLNFCFLVHGYRGMPSDLAYIEMSMKEAVENIPQSSQKSLHVHSAVCNEGRTSDGIEKGGDRLTHEILKTIFDQLDLAGRNCAVGNDDKYIVTLSFIGNSLGGLYSRFAISRLYQLMTMEVNGNELLDKEMVDRYNSILYSDSDRKRNNQKKNQRVQIRFNIFCSTASPHLGCAGNTYIPIPRSLEVCIGYALRQTGKDLFHINDLIERMCTEEKYLRPLSMFRKRMLYANAFQTDFPVGTKSAAFLHDLSHHPHYMLRYEKQDKKGSADDNDDYKILMIHKETKDDDGNDTYFPLKIQTKDPIIAIFYTGKVHPASMDSFENETHQKFSKKEDTLVKMSNSMDKLGWTKVFVDLRNKIPIGISIPIRNNKTFVYRGKEKDFEGKVLSHVDDLTEKVICTHKNNNETKEQEDVMIQSGEISKAFSSLIPPDSRLKLPIGHNMICAFSRTKFGTLVNRGGRPVMEKLVKNMVEDIFQFSGNN